MTKHKLRIFVVDDEQSRLRLLTVTKVPSEVSALARNQTTRIGPYVFRVYDGGPPKAAAATVFDIPNIGTTILTFPVAFCSDDEDVLVMTEARFRKLIVDHIVNPEVYDDEEEEEEEDHDNVFHKDGDDNDDIYSESSYGDMDDDDDDDDDEDEDDDDDDEEEQEEEEEEEDDDDS